MSQTHGAPRTQYAALVCQVVIASIHVPVWRLVVAVAFPSRCPPCHIAYPAHLTSPAVAPRGVDGLRRNSQVPPKVLDPGTPLQMPLLVRHRLSFPTRCATLHRRVRHDPGGRLLLQEGLAAGKRSTHPRLGSARCSGGTAISLQVHTRRTIAPSACGSRGQQLHPLRRAASGTHAASDCHSPAGPPSPHLQGQCYADPPRVCRPPGRLSHRVAAHSAVQALPPMPTLALPRSHA
mmetsp:Transcript_110644/g.214261  ORF Transcript_110644/g.214261 Transcript_110644/m.214261 type:complete len:235 (+) Transcript_110644:327-1031(+)